MISQRKILYPSLDLCEVCKWKLNRYDAINPNNITLRNKTSKLEDENDAFKGKYCWSCSTEIINENIFEKKEHIFDESKNIKVSVEKTCKSKLSFSLVSILVILILIVIVFALLLTKYTNLWNSKVTVNILDTELPVLMQKYPNQNQELWYNVLKITNATEPLVHALVLLHKGNSKVAECFAKDLIILINRIINKDGFAIYKESSEVVEYGVELNHYLKLVSQHNHLIVLQLNKIPGSTARMFHALCDQTPSSIRPSFFIFTMEDETEETTEVRRPLARAGRILRSAWSNLMENELNPLISRVVRNVAEILPENVTC